ncbi:hypothetical protein RGUI_2126 [Rhodovulum sp. P5]|uniref:hypothetical protein n=1 Tax=Rhodovulum sp. P5 TaxID=1564506 RepID=UPI0009C24B49|nr:hypothetical protein [Rhodovulum sp. P5]ARE40267.1 hypothetical protein RGUI_2126 [Rhodovulum sp. P5]
MRPVWYFTMAAGLCLAGTTTADAGAWLREDGTGVVYLSYEAMEDRDYGSTWGYSTLFGEYGLSPHLTVGIDAGRGDGPDDWKAKVFLRRGQELERLNGRYALQLGIGISGAPGGLRETLLRPAISWGNSFETGLGWAWVNVDAAGEYRLTQGTAAATAGYGVEATYKLDMALGLTTGARTQIMAELRSEFPPGEGRTLRAVPSVSRRVSGRVWLQLGGIVGLDGDDTAGLLVGSRIEF